MSAACLTFCGVRLWSLTSHGPPAPVGHQDLTHVMVFDARRATSTSRHANTARG